MFIVGYKMRYASGGYLNDVSGSASGAGRSGAGRLETRLETRLGTAAARLMDGLTGLWTERAPRASVPSRVPSGRLARPATRRDTAAHTAARERALEFVVEPLSAPSLVRPSHESHVLYVRLAAPSSGSSGSAGSSGSSGSSPAATSGRGRRHVSVLPTPGAAIAAEITRARAEGTPVLRAVLVGADAIVDPRAAHAPGSAEALAALVEAIGAFTAEKLPFVWRTRGGIDGAIPHAVGQALVDAGPHALVELGVPTLDPELCAALEGHVPPGERGVVEPEHRLRLAAALVARGVAVRGLIDPLVPMLTDQQQSLEALLAAFAEAGVHKVGARYIVLTRERARAVASRLAGMQRALLQGVFADEPWHKPDPEAGPREVHKRIPAHLRRAGHHRLLEAGARHGLFVDVLDPVEDGEEAEDLTDPGPSRERARPRAGRGERGPKDGAKHDEKRRPQLELFRKASKPG